MKRRSRYETREETRETIIRGRYRESYVPKSARLPPRLHSQDKSRQQTSRPRSIFQQQQRDERSTTSTEKSSLYNYSTDHSSQHTQQTDVRTNLSKPSLFDIAESSGATLAAAAISPFDERRRGSREYAQRGFFEEHDDDDDDLRESPSDEMPLDIVEKAIDKVVDAACGNMTADSGALAGSILAQTEAMILGEDGIVDPTIPNPFQGLRQEVRPVFEAASFPTVTFREVKLDPKKTVASTAMQYPEPLRPMIKPKISNTASAAKTRTKSPLRSMAKSPIRSMANRVKSVQNNLFRRRNRPKQVSSRKKAEYLDDKRAKVDRYTRARAHSEASDHSRSLAKHRRRPLDSQESQEDTITSFSTSTNDSVSITLPLHECPSVRDERTNRAQHNRSTRRRMQSDETDTSDPSLPPRLPLHKNRLRRNNPSDELSGARHYRMGGIISTDGSSFGFSSSADPHSSLQKFGSTCDSSSSSVSNDLIPQVSDYILPQDGSGPLTDVKEEISMLLQEQAAQVERIAIIRERRIQSDPITPVGEIGKRPDPPTLENETTAVRKTIKRRRAASQPNPHSHYQRMAQFFVPILFRLLSKYQRQALEFHQEIVTAIVPRCSSSQEYVISELVNVVVLLMLQNNSETGKKSIKESRRKRRRRRRKRSSVLDELCSQITVLDQKLLEFTNGTADNGCKAIPDEDPFVDHEETPFIEPIEDWSDDEAPPAVHGLLDEANPTEVFGGLQTNDPEFKDLIEMAFVVTDLSRDDFIDAHQNDSMQVDEDDDMEQELTNLSFVEEIIHSELSQVDSGEGTYQDESVVEEIIKTEVSQVGSREGTYQDESIAEEIVEIEVSQGDSSEGTYQDESIVEEIFGIEVSQRDSSEGTCQEVSVGEAINETEVSQVDWGERIYQEELIVEEIIEIAVSQDDLAQGTYHEESVIDVPVDELENQEAKDAALPVVERETNKKSKKSRLEAVKESLWDDDMFPDDELQDDAQMFPDDEMSKIDKTLTVPDPITAIPAMSRPEKKSEEAWKVKEDEDVSFPDLLSLPSDEREAVPKPSSSSFGPKSVATGQKKETISFKGTSVTTEVEDKGELLSLPSDEKEATPKSSSSDSGPKCVAARKKERLSFLLTTQNKYKTEDGPRTVVYAPRAKEAETLSSAVDYTPREREVASFQPALIVPTAEDYDDVTVESTPSDEASEAIGETGYINGDELADTPNEENGNGLETSVVECINENPAIEILVASASPVTDSEQFMQRLDIVLSCETEESDPICAAVNRKLAEVRQNGIPDPDDEMIMETIGMSMSINSASTAPRFTTSGVVPDPEDAMIIETILSPSGSLRHNDSPIVESDADNKVVMETVYLAESEMVTEKLFTVAEEGTTSSSPCNASRQTSMGDETKKKLEERQDTVDGRVRLAIMKLNGGGSSTDSSHKEASRVQKGLQQGKKDNSSMGRKDESPTLASNSSPSIGSQIAPGIQTFGKNGNPRQHLKPIGSHPKGVAAALIARYEASVGPRNILGVHPFVSREKEDAKASSPSTRSALACDAPVTGEIEAAMKRAELSCLNEPNSFAAQSTNEWNSPLVKPSPEPRQEAFCDDTPNLLAASSEPEPKVSKRQGEVHLSPSQARSQGKSGVVLNSPLIGESKNSTKINQPRSLFESTVSLKKSPPMDASPSTMLEHKNVTKARQIHPKIASKLQSKAPSKKQLPLHGFVKTTSRKDGPKPESLIDKAKPPVHQPSKNFSSSPLDFEALNESLLQLRHKEEKEQGDRFHEHQDNEVVEAADDESIKLPITELQLKQVGSLISELEGPRVKLLSRGMCNCLGAGEEGSLYDDNSIEPMKKKERRKKDTERMQKEASNRNDNSIELLKKIGRRKKGEHSMPKEASNLDEFVPPVFSMDAMLDDNMQRTADAAVKALELVLAKGAANAATAAAAITQSESQASCFKDCMTPVTEGSFNAFSQAVIPKPAKKRMIEQGKDDSLTPEDVKPMARKDERKATKLKSKSKSKSKENGRSPQKKPVQDALSLKDINEYDANNDWAQIAIQENNVDDLIEALRSKSSELDPFMNVSFEPTTPMTTDEHLSRGIDAPVSPIFSDWTGSAGRLGVRPMSATQRDAWSKRNLLSGSTTFSSEDSDYHLQPHGKDFNAQRVDIAFRFESPEGSIPGPYDGMIKEHSYQGRTPSSRPSSSRTPIRSMDPKENGHQVRTPSSRKSSSRSHKRSMDHKEQVHHGRTPTSRAPNSYMDPGRFEQNDAAISKGKREPANSVRYDHYSYTYQDRNGNVTQQKEELPDYCDFPAPPSHEISELTMSQDGDMALSIVKSQDQALKAFQEMENRVCASSEWLYESKREITTEVASPQSARPETEEPALSVNKEGTSSSSMWCSESLGFMIQDCFAAPQPTATTKDMNEEADRVATSERRRSAPDPPSIV